MPAALDRAECSTDMRRKKKKRHKRSADIPRTPYPEVQQSLRKEVHYACPVPECGRPLLEWHHFDPKWEEKHHHNPEGMIALCTSCHPKADRGKWTKDQLKSFKRNPAPLGLIREMFGWSEQSVLYRLGGIYAVDCRVAVLAIRGQRILWDDRSTEGRLLFSLDFFGERGQSLLQVRQNSLSVDASRIWDLSLNTSATYLKLWLGERKPGIELEFRRLSIDQLQQIRNKDLQHAVNVAKTHRPSWPPADLEFLPDSTGGGGKRFFIDYVCQNCLDSDGTVTLVDIARAKFYAPDGSLVDVSDTGIKTPNGSQWIACDAVACDYGFNL